jgi:hypothetical protein
MMNLHASHTVHWVPTLGWFLPFFCFIFSPSFFCEEVVSRHRPQDHRETAPQHLYLRIAYGKFAGVGMLHAAARRRDVDDGPGFQLHHPPTVAYAGEISWTHSWTCAGGWHGNPIAQPHAPTFRINALSNFLPQMPACRSIFVLLISRQYFIIVYTKPCCLVFHVSLIVPGRV